MIPKVRSVYDVHGKEDGGEAPGPPKRGHSGRMRRVTKVEATPWCEASVAVDIAALRPPGGGGRSRPCAGRPCS